MPGLLHELGWFAGIGVEILAFALIPAVLLRRRDPSSTIAWILTLVFLPGLGAALFLLHGRDRMRWPAKRKLAADAGLAAQLERARERTRTDASTALTELDELGKDLFRLCEHLGTWVDVTPGNRITLYSNGHEAMLAIEDAIEHAETCVFAEYYLVRNDAAGERFREALARAARRGVDVRLLVDAYGSFWLPKRWSSELVRAGAKVEQFLPLALALQLPMNLRTHRKILVVDGREAFTGGLNIGDEYVGEKAGQPMWRDSHVRIVGPAAASLTSIFLSDWHFMTGTTETEQRFFPLTPEVGSAIVAVVPSGPDDPHEAIHRAFFAAIVGARRRAWITTPYFVPDRSLLVALETAARRGVEVKLLLPAHSNHRVTHAAGRSFYGELLDAGVQLYEYLPGMIHAKTMLVDDHIGFVGSANMDMRSFRLNFEVHTLAHDASLALDLAQAFERDLTDCRRIEPASWRARSAWARVREGGARLLSPIL